MRNNFHYGFGIRLTAVLLTLMMVLSLGGFVLRDTGMGVDEPMIFDESYGTPAPVATKVPEATEVPAEDTTAPEATGAPGEATPAPETDSGTDTNMATSEPEPTADPQVTHAPEAEATAVPMGDMPADGPQMDEPAPIAAAPNIVLTLTTNNTSSDPEITYTLTIANNSDTPWTIKDEDNGNDIEICSSEQESLAGGAGLGIRPAFDTTAKDRDTRLASVSDYNLAFNANAQITKDTPFKIALTLKNSDSSSKQKFEFKMRNIFSGGSGAGYILFTHTGNTINAVTNGKVAISVPTASNSSGEGGGGGTGTGVKYHLNPPTGPDAEYEQKDTDGEYVLNIDDLVDMKAPGFSGVDQSGKYGADHYFAGWSATPLPVNANGSYGDLIYPVIRSQLNKNENRFPEYEAKDYTKYDNDAKTTIAGFRHIADHELTAGDVPSDLYAVWMTTDHSGLLGYAMVIDTAALAGFTDSGLAQSGAKKYVYLDEGHGIGAPVTVTNTVPLDTAADPYTFITWRNKGAESGSLHVSESDGNPYVFPGQTVLFGSTNDLFSLDAVWGKLTAPEKGDPIRHDGKAHTPGETDVTPGTVKLHTTGFNRKDIFATDAIPTYTVTVERDGKSYTTGFAPNDYANKKIVTGDGDFDVPLPGVTEVGEYIYTITVTFTDKQDGNQKTILETTAELTIENAAQITYHFNAPGVEDIEAVYTPDKTGTAGAEEEYTYYIKQLQDAFSKDAVTAKGITVSKDDLDQGDIITRSGHYYFAGWSFDRTVRDYINVDYRVLDFKDDRQLTGDPTLVTRNDKEDLYAVWADKPGLLSYRMVIPNATLGDHTSGSPVGTKGIISRIAAEKETTPRLGETLLADYGSGSSWSYLDISHGHDNPEEVFITSVKPEATDGHTFITWYADKGLTDPFIFPGGRLGFNTGSVYSIHAVWGMLTPSANGGNYYTGELQGPGDFTLDITGHSNLTADMFNNNVDATYTVTVAKDDGGFESTDITDEAITLTGGAGAEHTVSLPLPQVKDVGKYTYNVKVTFKDNDSEAEAASISKQVVYVIEPVLKFQVKKVVKEDGEERSSWGAGEKYEFTLSGTVSTSPNRVTVTSPDTPEEFGWLHLQPSSSYTFTVSEPPGSDPNMRYAPSQTVTVTTDEKEPFDIYVGGSPVSGGTGVRTHELTFTNELLKGQLTFVKTVHHEVKAEGGEIVDGKIASESFIFQLSGGKDVAGKSFSVKVDGEPLPTDPENKFDDSGVCTFTLKDFEYSEEDGLMTARQTVVFTDLPLGVTYTIKETDGADNYATMPEDRTVTAALDTNQTEGTVSIVNNHFPGSLVITKLVHDPYMHDIETGEDVYGQKFTFGIKVTRTTAEGDTVVVPGGAYTAADGGGVYKVTLSDGGVAVINGLNDGDTYTITEEPSPHYNATVRDVDVPVTGVTDTLTFGTGASEEKNSVHVPFTNTFKSGDLILSKTVTGDHAPEGREFLVRVTLSNDGAYEPGDWETIKGMISKTNLEKGQKDPNVVVGVDVAGDAKVLILRMTDKSTISLPDLPAGLTFQVTEEPVAGFTPSYTLGGRTVESATGTIPDKTKRQGAAVVGIVNDFRTGHLSVEKILEEGGNAYGRFTMNVTLSDAAFDGTYQTKLEKNGSVRPEGSDIKTVTFTNGKTSFVLYGGEKLTIQDLPQGVGFTVTETGAAEKGYRVDYTGDGAPVPGGGRQGKIAAKATMAVTVTNTFGGGILTVQKVLEGTANETDKAFNFTLDLHDDSITGNRGAVEFTEGVARFSLKGGEHVTIPGLRAGLRFTLTEDEANTDGYETTYAVDDGEANTRSATGTIDEKDPITVKVTNKKDASGGGGGGGGGVSPPWTWPTATPEASPTPGASPSPSPSAGPSPAPGGTPGPAQTSRPFYTPGPGGSGGNGGSGNGGNGSGGSGNGTGGSTAPATGDETAIAPWAILLALSMAGLAAVIMIGRRRRGRN